MPDGPKHDDTTAGYEQRPLPPPERLQELLFDAARLGRADMVLALGQAGIDLEAHDPGGYTALILASYHGSLQTTQALLEAGAAVDAPDLTRGNTALMGVAFKGFGEIARCLLAAGADLDRRNRAGQTALMMAALFGHGAIVEELIASGASPDLVDIAGNSARSVAATQRNDAMILLLGAACPAVGTLDG
jgi:ankyrin repeat protein